MTDQEERESDPLLIIKKAMLTPGIKAMKYSGRGMLGMNCLAFECVNDLQKIDSIVFVAKNVDRKLIANMKEDDLGYNTVVYFPDIHWPFPTFSGRRLIDRWQE